MSSSARPRSKALARTVIFATTVFASIATSTAVVGLDPAEPDQTPASNEATVAQQPGGPGPAVGGPLPAPADECSEFFADYCIEIVVPAPAQPDLVSSCSTGADHNPAGDLVIVPAADGGGDDPSAIRVRVEIEDGLAIAPACFASEVLGILNDERGWAGTDGIVFQQVADDAYDLRIILASPARTDTLCYPARTAGRYSCHRDGRVILNLMRWELGTDEYLEDLSTYRTYLVTHEVGHYLGRGHKSCPGVGEPAPVMMQQTKGLGECLPNGWPTKDES